MINQTVDRVRETSNMVAERGKALFDQRVSPMIPENVKEMVKEYLDKLETQRDRLEKEGREFFAANLAVQGVEVQKRVLGTLDEVLHRVNATTKERFDILAKGIGRIETRLESLEQKVEQTVEAAEAKVDEQAAAVLPIKGYDEMNVGEVQEALEGLDKTQLELLNAYETEHKARKTVLEAIESALA